MDTPICGDKAKNQKTVHSIELLAFNTEKLAITHFTVHWDYGPLTWKDVSTCQPAHWKTALRYPQGFKKSRIHDEEARTSGSKEQLA